jgi:hypothetical protein
LKSRIDPKIEVPHQRSFDFDPVQLTRQNRQRMVAAALTLIRAHQLLGGNVRFGPGRMASFEEWDDLIRQTVCWLAELQKQGAIPTGTTLAGMALPSLVDPFEAVADSVLDDPEIMQLGRLLEAWATEIGTGTATKVTVKDLIKRHAGSRTTTSVSNVSGALLAEVLEEIAGILSTVSHRDGFLG